MSNTLENPPVVEEPLFVSLPPALRAAVIFAVPFMIVDFFNYYTAGAAMVISLPLLAIFYVLCAMLAGKYAADRGRHNFISVGVAAGLLLWTASTVVNTIVALLIGTATLGSTLLLGIPYLCLCAPIQLAGSMLAGIIGGVIYGWINGRK